jgi:hypothetical protein
MGKFVTRASTAMRTGAWRPPAQWDVNGRVDNFNLKL